MQRETLMKAIKWMTAAAVLGLSPILFAGESSRIIVSHYESLQRLNIQSDSVLTSEKLRGAGPVTLSFDALGSSFHLLLEPNDGLLSFSSQSALADGVEIYRGQLAGKPDSWARIVVFGGAPRGIIWDGTQLLAIEDMMLNGLVVLTFLN